MTALPDKPPLPRSDLKRWLVLALKLLVAGGLLYYVFAYKVDQKDKERLVHILLHSPEIMALAIFTISLQFFIGAQRLRMLLIPQDVHLGYFHTLKLTYLGAFFDTFMLTSVGGDAVKAWYLAQECPKEKRLGAVSVLILDRLLGLLGLLTLTVVMTLWNIRELHSDESIRPYIIWLFIVPALLMVGTFMLLSNQVRMWEPMQAILKIIPMGSTIDKAYDSLQRFRDRPSILLSGWVMSLASHIAGVLAGYILMIGLDQHADLGKFFVAWFISGFITSFAPFGGIGTGQVLYDLVFVKIVGLPEGMGAILATTMQITVLVAKSPGFIAWILSRRHSHHTVHTPTLNETEIHALKGTQK